MVVVVVVVMMMMMMMMMMMLDDDDDDDDAFLKTLNELRRFVELVCDYVLGRHEVNRFILRCL